MIRVLQENSILESIHGGSPIALMPLVISGAAVMIVGVAAGCLSTMLAFRSVATIFADAQNTKNATNQN